MASVFGLIGYGPVESLQFFLNRFIENCSIIELDKELEKVWISHKSLQSLKRFQLSLNDDHFRVECKKIHSNPHTELGFVFTENSQNHFSSQRILEGIMTKLHCCLVHYVITECLVLYNWGVNAFELVFDNKEFCIKLLKNQYNFIRRPSRNDEEHFRKWRMILTSQTSNLYARRLRRDSCDFFEEKETKRQNGGRRSISYYRKLDKIYKDFDKPIGDMRQENRSNMNVFDKDKILYDIKQKTWPKNHALSSSTSNRLLKDILKEEKKFENGVSGHTGRQYTALKRILDLLLRNHKKLMAFDGYGRLLKRHLKVRGFSNGSALNRTLKPIPSKVVSSYIAIILHKVVPFEFFGSNRLRKRFFRETSRILSGEKSENFIFNSLIQTFLDVKNNLAWVHGIQGSEVVRRVISNIVKWMLLDYIFLLLKNHFYITDVGSSGYRLYYYRKNDVESAVSRWVNKQVQMENLGFVKGHLDHWTSVERKWLETGKIELNGNFREIKMPKSTEHIYPVANVRFLPKTGRNSDLRIITSYRVKKTILRSGETDKKNLVHFFMNRHARRLSIFKKMKLLLQFLTDEYGSGIKPLPHNPKLEMAWIKAIHLKQIHGKLYYVKADVSDAFGSVVPSLLGAIIEEKLRAKSNHVLQLKKIRECRGRKGGIECRIRTSFSDRPLENGILVSRSIFVGSQKKLPSFNSRNLKTILDQVIQHQYLRINGKHYKLMRGLTQGSAGSVSSFLCNIYYSEMDRLHFRDFAMSNECILLRGVDDYLLLTSDIEKAKKFHDIVYNGIKDFNVTFNRGKLKSNITDDSSSCVSYLGLIFDVKNLCVKPDFTRFRTKDVLSTMKLSDTDGDMFLTRTRFIRLRSMAIAPLKLFSLTLNEMYNTVSDVRETVYAACIIQSNRVLALTRHLIRGGEINELDLCVILSENLRKISAAVTSLNRHVTKLEVSWLFWMAALFVCRKFSGNFPALLILIRHRVDVSEGRFAKSDCENLLNSARRDLAQWKDMHETWNSIIERSKMSN